MGYMFESSYRISFLNKNRKKCIIQRNYAERR